MGDENFSQTSSRVLATSKWAFVVWHLLQGAALQAGLLWVLVGLTWAAFAKEGEAVCVTEGHWNMQCVFVLPEARPPQCQCCQGLRMPFFFCDAQTWRMLSHIAYHVSVNVIHTKIFRCSSWSVSNCYILVLVFSSISSSIFKWFQWFGSCSVTKNIWSSYWMHSFSDCHSAQLICSIS